jgi:hypothetical protein
VEFRGEAALDRGQLQRAAVGARNEIDQQQSETAAGRVDLAAQRVLQARPFSLADARGRGRLA